MVGEYWKKKWKEYNQWSDAMPETDLADSGNHSCRPKDPQVGLLGPPTRKGNKVGVLCTYMLELKGAAGTVL